VRQKTFLATTAVILAMFFAQGFLPALHAQADAAGPPPTADQLDQLLAPVALYPDSLLAQITTASTDPQEILDVDNWLQANPDLTGTALTDAAQAQGFDPAFIALTNFPQVLQMMAENVDDYAAIGQAFTADQASVSASIQRLRAQAYSSGALRSNSEMQVDVQQPAAGQTVYVIQPASPQIVYVPQYDPAVVYVGPGVGGPAPVIAFGAGIAIGALLVDNRPWGWGGWGWNWGSHRAYYNGGVWVGWGNPYRPPNYWYRPRPVRWASRPGYGGNWRYRPPNYRHTSYPGNRPGIRPPHRQPWGPNNRPSGYRPGRPGNGGSDRPSTRPRPSNPNRPSTDRPSSNRPGTSRPDRTPSKPGDSTRPNTGRPGTNRPSTGQPDKTPSKPGDSTRPSTGRPGTNRPSTGQPDKTPSKPGDSTRPSTGRPGTNRPSTGQPDKTPSKPGDSSRPSTNRPSQPDAKPATRPQRDASQPKPAASRPQAQPKPQPQPKPATPRPQPKPAPQSRPAPKPQPTTQPQPR
jgi:hypothetical protein